MGMGIPKPATMATVHFVLDDYRWRDIAGLREGDIVHSPERFVGGRNSWIAQTYLRLQAPLAARGWRVTAGPGYAPRAVNVAHRDDANRFFRGGRDSFLVVVRADRAPATACDLAIVQN